MRGCFFLVSLAVVAIGIGLLTGVYMVDVRYNQRAQLRTCDIFCDFSERMCSDSAGILRPCYDLVQNTRPQGQDIYCWNKQVLATFASPVGAPTCIPYSRPCYWDPQSPCTFTWFLSDTTASLYIGVAFTLVGALLLFALIIEFGCSRCRRQDE